MDLSHKSIDNQWVYKEPFLGMPTMLGLFEEMGGWEVKT